MTLEQHRDKINIFSGNKADIFEVGFDAAIALQLHIKFTNWIRMAPPAPLGDNRYIGHISTEELYNHWLDNIFKIES